jgi:preprotein translocase subunit SecG
MYGIILGILIIISVFLVVFILMQSDKGGGLAGTFGGMGGGNMPFSGREAATILSKLTTGLAIAFMAICILLSIMSRNRAHTNTSSALQKRAQKMQHMESQSAASVLDQKLPLGGGGPGAPAGEEGQANIPGVTREEAQPAPASQAAPVAKQAAPAAKGAAPAPAPAKPAKEEAKPLFGN